MVVRMSLFVDDPEQGPIDEAEFDGVADIAALLDPENPAGVEISASTGEVIVRDNLDDLIAGLCLGGGEALTSGGCYSNVSFAGFDTALIASDGDTARFESEGDTLSAPRDECLVALRGLAGRYVGMLEKVFPDDADRRSRLAAFAKG